MKTKQEQIEEMAFSTCDVPKTMQFLSKHRGENIKFENCRDCEFYNSCQHINDTEYFYSAGYRKASEVIDEFFDEIMKKVDSYRKSELFDAFSIRLIVNEARVNIKTKICLENAEMRQEVEK